MTTIDRYVQIGEAVRHVVLELGDDGAGTAVIDDGEPIEITLPSAGANRFTVPWGGRAVRVVALRDGRGVELSLDGARVTAQPTAGAAAAAQGGSGLIKAPMPGKVVEVAVEVGQAVARGDKTVVVEAMKMRSTLTAGVDGTIKAVACAEGDQVTGGQVLVEIEEADDE
jgi:biotin carboxyl carrier protein